MGDDTKKPGKSLDEAAIKTTRTDRRTLLRTAGIAGIGAGALGLSGCVAVPVGPVYGGSGYTDSDNGPITDPGGYGRGPTPAYYTGITDADNGPIVDPGGRGRG
jgi:hypothetical protein